MINRVINYIKDNSFKIIYINNQVNVINYDKILELKEDSITFIRESKVIIIKGNDLKLTKLLDNEVLIEGYINKIEM